MITPPYRWRDVLGLRGVRTSGCRRLWRWLLSPISHD